MLINYICIYFPVVCLTHLPIGVSSQGFLRFPPLLHRDFTGFNVDLLKQYVAEEPHLQNFPQMFGGLGNPSHPHFDVDLTMRQLDITLIITV